MNKNIEKIVGIVQKLEQDFAMMNKENEKSMEMMKDRAHMLLPTIKIAKDDPKNFSYKKVYEKLEHKIASVISQLE
jgi:hypothetical protein